MLLVALLGGVGPRSTVVAAPGEPTLGPLISGTTSVVAGTHVWTDYAYDDRSTAAASAPSYSPANAADLIQLQLRPGAGGLDITAVLETLTDPAVPSIGVGLDLDADPLTGAAQVPGGTWVATGTPLGLERVVVATGAGTEVLSWDGARWLVAGAAPATADAEANTVVAHVPWDLLPERGSTWRVVGLAGLAVPGATWVDGSGPIHDLAYVRDTSSSNFQADRQAAVLRGAEDAASAVASITPAELATTVLARPVAGEKNTFLYRSDLELGEGIGTGNRVYAGPYQPYVAWFPADLPPDPPLVVFLHGAMSTHLSGSYGGDDSLVPGLPLGPGVIAPRAVIVTPLARGETPLGVDGPAEQDVLDVIDDVSGRFGVDDDRVVLTGYSLGGVGTFRLAQLYPDRWAGAVEIVGADDLGALTVVEEAGGAQSLPNALENLRNLPFRMAHSRLDELELLIGGVQPDRAALELHALGYDYRYWQFYAREHLTFPVAMIQCELEAAIARGRVHDPARVTYSQAPAIVTDDESIGLDLDHDAAYWMSAMVPRGTSFAPGAEATVDVTSLARADRVPTLQTLAGATLSLGGRDVCGDNAAIESADAWTFVGQAWLPGGPQPTSNGFVGTLTGVASVALDVRRMALDPTQPIDVTVTSDGPATIRLDGACPDGRAIDLDLASGRSALQVLAADRC